MHKKKNKDKVTDYVLCPCLRIAKTYKIVYTEYITVTMRTCEKRMEEIMKKFMTVLLTMMVSASLLTGCGGSGGSPAYSSEAPMDNAAGYSTTKADYGMGVAQNSYASMDTMAAAADDAVYGEAEYEEERDNSTQNMDSMTLLEEKLVYRCNLAIETLDYAGTIKSIKEAISKYGGIIQSENETDSSYDWYYADYHKTQGTMRNYIEVRVPTANYDSFVSALDGIGKITSKSTSIDNISQQYYDTTTQIEALKIQEKNLLEMLEQCSTIEEMITVQDRLTSVQYDINRLQTNKRYMDVDVAYSYVNISIDEVMEFRIDEEPVKTNTFMDRLVNTVKSTYSGFLMFLEMILFLIIRLFPYLVIVGIIVLLVLRKKLKSRREEKKQSAKEEQ